LRRADGSPFTSSGGEVRLADGGRLEFGITSERYKRWDAAQRGLDRRIAARYGALLQPRSPTERSIDRATAYLESEPRARGAIERAGMNVREFVLTTVALDQEMRSASGRGAMEAPQPMPAPLPYPYAIDSAYAPQPFLPAPAAPVPPVPQYPRADSVPRVDTVFVSPSRDTVLRQSDTARRRDTLSVTRPPRDTFSITRPARDTLRDTTRRIPPDTLSRR
jgi:hypothetical protein